MNEPELARQVTSANPWWKRGVLATRAKLDRIEEVLAIPAGIAALLLDR